MNKRKIGIINERTSYDIDNYLQIIDFNNDQLNDDVYEISDDNIKLNEFFENIRIAAQSSIQEGKICNFFYLPKIIDRLLKIGKELPILDSSVYSFLYVIQSQIVKESSEILKMI